MSHVTTNSSLVWKRMADENQQSARFFARVCMGLIVMLIAAGGYAYSTNSRYNDLCTALQITVQKNASTFAQPDDERITSSYCS
ncbi:MAG: hypothetical protein KDK89_18540 [Alphaproteobacteria bacterium]|nr:hypothetical protein [Alphaproteobacteria bacterium]